MGIIYFDICAIPLFLMILAICFFRKMTKGDANRLFIAVVFLSLFSTLADLGMEIPNNLVPLSEAGRTVCSVSTYVYLILQRINHIPLKLVKIDKSMLEEVHSENGRLILESTVRMMQSIGKLLVVEGAETRDEVELLKAMNCDYIQGFYYSKPLPEAQFLRFIEAQNRLD